MHTNGTIRAYTHDNVTPRNAVDALNIAGIRWATAIALPNGESTFLTIKYRLHHYLAKIVKIERRLFRPNLITYDSSPEFLTIPQLREQMFREAQINRTEQMFALAYPDSSGRALSPAHFGNTPYSPPRLLNINSHTFDL